MHKFTSGKKAPQLARFREAFPGAGADPDGAVNGWLKDRIEALVAEEVERLQALKALLLQENEERQRVVNHCAWNRAPDAQWAYMFHQNHIEKNRKAIAAFSSVLDALRKLTEPVE